jgi:pimeloyl-ACP methyl ester carboxylesterase
MHPTTSSAIPPEYFTRADGVRLAYRHLPGNGPAIVFLPGYMSDMQGGKALAIEAWAAANGRAMLRLDYAGCGESDGEFADATFDQWRDDVTAMIAQIIGGPVILAGSSMGGWLMLMIALALKSQVKALIGIAAAPDFTDWGFSEFQRATIARDGVIFQDNPYGPDPTPTYAPLFRSGQANRMLTAEIPLDCPVRLIHGQCDADVPWDISMQIASRLRSSDVQVTLIKDGDHRLSRDEDIRLLLDIITALPSS